MALWCYSFGRLWILLFKKDIPLSFGVISKMANGHTHTNGQTARQTDKQSVLQTYKDFFVQPVGGVKTCIKVHLRKLHFCQIIFLKRAFVIRVCWNSGYYSYYFWHRNYFRLIIMLVKAPIIMVSTRKLLIYPFALSVDYFLENRRKLMEMLFSFVSVQFAVHPENTRYLWLFGFEITQSGGRQWRQQCYHHYYNIKA